MPLLEEMITIGAITSTPDADSALKKIAEAASRGDKEPPDLTDAELEALEDLKDQLRDGFNCKRLRDFLYNLGVFGCARSRRIKAIAAVLGIPYDQIKDCLSKDKAEADEEYQSLIFLAPEPPHCDDPDFLSAEPVLRDFLCEPPPEPIEPGGFCPAPTLPFEPLDNTDIPPLPNAPCPDTWRDICTGIADAVNTATATGKPLNDAQLSLFTRLLHAGAFSSTNDANFPTLRCISDTSNTLLTHIADNQTTPPRYDYDEPLQELRSEAEEKIRDETSRIAETSTWLNDVLDFYSDIGLNKSQKSLLIEAISAVLQAAITLGDERLITQITYQLAFAQTITYPPSFFDNDQLLKEPPKPFIYPNQEVPEEIWPLFEAEPPILEIPDGLTPLLQPPRPTPTSTTTSDEEPPCQQI